MATLATKGNVKQIEREREYAFEKSRDRKIDRRSASRTNGRHFAQLSSAKPANTERFSVR
jgi:hypothetical protein